MHAGFFLHTLYFWYVLHHSSYVLFFIYLDSRSGCCRRIRTAGSCLNVNLRFPLTELKLTKTGGRASAFYCHFAYPSDGAIP